MRVSRGHLIVAAAGHVWSRSFGGMSSPAYCGGSTAKFLLVQYPCHDVRQSRLEVWKM